MQSTEVELYVECSESPEERVTNSRIVSQHSSHSYSRILLPPKKPLLKSCRLFPFLDVETQSSFSREEHLSGLFESSSCQGRSSFPGMGGLRLPVELGTWQRAHPVPSSNARDAQRPCRLLGVSHPDPILLCFAFFSLLRFP